jgi:hypothetical protein
MLYHSFSKVPLKKRIIMLFSKPSAKVKRAVYILVLPVILISCLAFANIKKDDIKNFSLVKTSRNILNAIKTGQDGIIDAVKAGQGNLVEQLNQPVRIPVILPDAHSIKTIGTNTAFQQRIAPVSIIDTTRYSVFGDVSRYSKIIINGKEYPKDKFYEINNTNMTGLNSSKDPQTEQWVFNVKTQNGEIIYLTPHEKENLRKEQSIPKSDFYTRLALTKDNGERYDFIAVHLPSSRSRGGSRIAPDDKVVFLIDGRLYDENEIKTVSSEILASFKSISSATYRPDMLYQTKYKVVFTLITPEYEQQHAAENFVIPKPLFSDGKTYALVRNYVVAGYPTDTIAYNARPFKTDLGPDAKLIELINRLPNFTTKENAIYIGEKAISVLFVDRREYAGSVMVGLKNIPIGNAAEIRVTSPDPQNKNPAILYIINKPNN